MLSRRFPSFLFLLAILFTAPLELEAQKRLRCGADGSVKSLITQQKGRRIVRRAKPLLKRLTHRLQAGASLSRSQTKLLKRLRAASQVCATKLETSAPPVQSPPDEPRNPERGGVDPCRLDVNHDGVVNVGDFPAVIQLFLASNFDFNYDGAHTVADLTAYRTAFLAHGGGPVDCESSTISARINASRLSCVAPCGVFFDGTGTTADSTDREFEDLVYYWDFGDSSSSFINRPDVSSNRAQGPLAAHVFDRAGDYDVRLTVLDHLGGFATATVRVSVQNPEAVYSGKTYCVSVNGNFAGCPTSDSSRHLRTLEAGIDALFGGSGPRRVLLRRGETFSGTINKNSKNGPYHLGAFGAGVDPIIMNNTDSTTMTLMYDVNDLSISGIQFKGPYNAHTGLGRHPNGLFLGAGVRNITLYRNTFSGLGLTIYSLRTDADNGARSYRRFLADNHITNWQDYGVYGSLVESAVIGNRIRQRDDAVSGTEEKCGSCVPNFPDHGPLRIDHSDKAVIAMNDLFSNTGWSSQGLAHQPNLRIGTDGIANDTVITENLMEGGHGMLTPATKNSDTTHQYGRILIERNRLLASANTEVFMTIGFGGTTVRNNLFLKPNNGGHPGFSQGGLHAVIELKAYASTPENRTAKQIVENNTAISLEQGTARNLKFIFNYSYGFPNVQVRNNIMHSPHANGLSGLLKWDYQPGTGGLASNNNLLFTPIAASRFAEILGAPRSLAQWRGLGFDQASSTSDPRFASGALNPRLLAGSPAIDAGAAVRGQLEDFFLAPRPVDGNGDGTSRTDIGAVEYR